MFVGEDGRVSGSINVEQVLALYADTDDDDLKAHYREVLGYDPNAGEVEVEESAAEPAPLPDPLSRPSDSAMKADWVAYAVAKGADRTEAENSTKADLIAAYG